VAPPVGEGAPKGWPGGQWAPIQSVGGGRGIGVPKRRVRHAGNGGSPPFAREKPPPPPLGHRSPKSRGSGSLLLPLPSEGLPLWLVWGSKWPKASLGQVGLRPLRWPVGGGGGRRWPVGEGPHPVGRWCGSRTRCSVASGQWEAREG
jgi:hypothetical protein